MRTINYKHSNSFELASDIYLFFLQFLIFGREATVSLGISLHLEICPILFMEFVSAMSKYASIKICINISLSDRIICGVEKAKNN